MHLHIQPSETMAAKEVLYYYSAYQKDLAEAKQAEEMRKAQRRRNQKKNTISIPMGR